MKVNLPKVEEETRSGLNIIKARRKDKSLDGTLNYLIDCEKQHYLPEYVSIVVKSETLDRLKKYGPGDANWDKLLNNLMDEVDTLNAATSDLTRELQGKNEY